ncbi:MAG: ATP-binding protein [Armatimonadota bacterium]
MSSCDSAILSNFLRSILGSMDIQAMILDSQGRILYATPQVEDEYAPDNGSLVSSLFDSILSPRNPEWLGARIRRDAAKGSWTGDLVLKKNNGTSSWSHMRVIKLPSDAESPEFLVLVEDITERFETSELLISRLEQLYSRNQELESLVTIGKLLIFNNEDLDSQIHGVLRETIRCANADVGAFYVVDRRSGALVCKAACGHPNAADFVGYTLHPDQESLAQHAIRTCRVQMSNDLENDPHVPKEVVNSYGIKCALCLPVIASDEAFGAIALCRFSHRPFSKHEVSLAEVVANHAALALRNIFLGQDLALSHACWQYTFDSIDDVVAVVDRSGVILRVNAPFARLLGVPVSCLVGANVSGLRLGLNRRSISKLLDTSRPRSLGEKIIGREICEFTAFPLADATSSLEGVVLRGRIVTRERSLEESLDKACHLAVVGELLAGAAHSFGDVVTAIMGALTTSYCGREDEVSHRIERALGHAKKGEQIVRRLLSLSRGVEEPLRRVSLSEVARDAVNLCCSHPIAKQRRIVNLVHGGTPEVEARFGQLEEVVINLLLNALRATGPGGEVRLESDHDPVKNQVLLKVIDNGPGMSQEVTERIFEPFFSTTDGTGVGLSYSACAIRRMGGSITATSVPGCGTTFTISLNAWRRKSDTSSHAA